MNSNGSNPKFKSTKFPNQKIQPKPNAMLHPDPFHMQGYTRLKTKGWRKTQNKGIYQPNGEQKQTNKQINK